jgi:hypothetical protein
VWCKLKGFTELWAGQIVNPAEASAAALALRAPDTFLVSFFPDQRYQVTIPSRESNDAHTHDGMGEMHNVHWNSKVLCRPLTFALQWVPPDKIFDFEEHYEKYAKQPIRGKVDMHP